MGAAAGAVPEGLEVLANDALQALELQGWPSEEGGTGPFPGDGNGRRLTTEILTRGDLRSRNKTRWNRDGFRLNCGGVPIFGRFGHLIRLLVSLEIIADKSVGELNKSGSKQVHHQTLQTSKIIENQKITIQNNLKMHDLMFSSFPCIGFVFTLRQPKKNLLKRPVGCSESQRPGTILAFSQCKNPAGTQEKESPPGGRWLRKRALLRMSQSSTRTWASGASPATSVENSSTYCCAAARGRGWRWGGDWVSAGQDRGMAKNVHRILRRAAAGPREKNLESKIIGGMMRS